MRVIIFTIVSLILLYAAMGSAFGRATYWNDYDEKYTVYKTNEPVKFTSETTTQSLRVLMKSDGTLLQLPWLNQPKKFAMKTNSGLLLENVFDKELTTSTIYKSDWQLPKNATLLIKQYKTDPKTGSVSYTEKPISYALTTTSDTLIVVQWVKKGFSATKVQDDSTTITQIPD